MALDKVTTFDLELSPGGIPPIIHASQGDIGRKYTANLYWNGTAYTPGSGVTCKLRGKKPDNTVFEYSQTISSATVAFATAEQMTIVSGGVECELVLTDTSDNVIASANFLLIVENSPYNPNAPSTSDITGIGTNSIEDEAITTPKLANNAVTTPKLATDLQTKINQSDPSYWAVLDDDGNVEAVDDGGTVYDIADNNLRAALLSGDEADAQWHLGFYLDEDGDLCQLDD